MYNFNNLEEMLRSGVSADEIALAFTKNLNAAMDAAKPTPMQKASEELSKAPHSYACKDTNFPRNCQASPPVFLC